MSNLARGLRVVADGVLPFNNRPEAADIVIVVTKGHTNNWEREVLPAARAVKAAGATLIPVGLFTGVNPAELRLLATNSAEVVLVADARDFATKLPQLVRLMCQQRETNSKHVEIFLFELEVSVLSPDVSLFREHHGICSCEGGL